MVLEADQIQKGIAYVRTKIIGFVEEQSYSAKEETTAFKKWDQFWEYFERFWMQDEFFKLRSHPQWCFFILLWQLTMMDLSYFFRCGMCLSFRRMMHQFNS